MKKYTVLVLAFCVSLSFAGSALAQEHGMLLGTASLHGSKFSGQDFTVQRRVNPGAEAVFGLGKRFAVAGGFTTGMQFSPETFTTTIVSDRFRYLDSARRLVTIEMPGTVFASDTTSKSARLGATVYGMAYVNLVTSGPLRPFVGGGYGTGSVKEEFRVQGYVHPLYAELTGFAFEGPSAYSHTKRMSFPIAKGGINIRPARHLVLRLAGGYLRGGFAEVGAGITF